MMAYLDWSTAKDERIEIQVAKEMGENPLANKKRGMKDIWESVRRDSEKQEALYSSTDLVKDCIVVRK
jgi:hypothetical protein